MSKIKFHISPDVVRRANTRLITNGSGSVVRAHSGIEARYKINGKQIIRNISSDDVKQAYAKSLAEYAQKL